MQRPTIALLAALALPAATAVPAPAQTAPPAEARPRAEPLFASRDWLYAGGVVLATAVVAPFDRRFADYLQGSPQTNKFFRRTARVVRTVAQPGGYIIGGGLYAVGRLARNDRMADLGLHGTEAILLGLGVTGVLKYGAGRARPCVVDSIGAPAQQRLCVPGRLPDGFSRVGNPRNFRFWRGAQGEPFRSFPSGHTLIAFAAAAAVTEEARLWNRHSVWYVAPVMYGGAGLVGLSRMYNNRHWASDVLIGGAMGAFSGRKVVRYQHTRPQNRVDRWLLGVTLSEETGTSLWLTRRRE